MERPLINHVILLVDDSEDDARLLSHQFAKAGLRNPIIWVSNGMQAIEVLSDDGATTDHDRNSRPSIILLDLVMPHMDGFELLEWIRKQPELKNLLVVVLSGSDDTKSVQRAYALGANSYLTKPINPHDLANMAQFFQGYWMIADHRAEPGSAWNPGSDLG